MAKNKVIKMTFWVFNVGYNKMVLTNPKRTKKRRMDVTISNR